MARVVENYGPPPWEEVQGTKSCKYARLNFALSATTPWVRDLIRHMLSILPGDRRYTVVDIKFWPKLRPGQAPALLGWHLDCVKDPNDPLPGEHHAIYQSGAQCFTRFHDITVKDGDIVRFDREYHTAALALEEGPRLLVRVTQSDHIRGTYRLIKPTTKECSDVRNPHGPPRTH